MATSWIRAFGARWGLPDAALEELRDALDGDPDRAPALPSRLDAAPPAQTRMRLYIRPPDGDAGPSHGEAVRDPAERYEDLGPIGSGGMGEVRRVWDYVLSRALAMKILRRDHLDRADLIARFQEEAEATAQLDHPAIVPIHDFGFLDDGRAWFTMKEIRGRTLLDVIDEVHQADGDGWEPSPTGWTLLRLIQAFHQVCEAIAYAHSRNVLHRDLKPTNVMVGAFGEVVVMDWGLAKVAHLGELQRASLGARRPVLTERAAQEAYLTQAGSVAGTPSYMPPEQARGDTARMGPWSDVYALGAILYHILSDRPPYEGHDHDVLARVVEGPPPPPGRRGAAATALEEGLVAICDKAMARDLAARYGDATSLAEAVADWLDGARLREHAVALVARADALQPRADKVASKAARLRSEAARLLREVGPTAPEADKRAGWEVEDQALQADAELRELRAQQITLLRAALAQVELPHARARLDALAESSRRRTDAPARLSLQTVPTGLEVTARRVVLRDRRLVPADAVPLGRAPVVDVTLPEGTWQIEVDWAGRTTSFPIRAEGGRDAGLTGLDGAPVPVVLHGLRAEDCLVPAGWCICGGDPEPDDALARAPVWVDGFVMRRDPVTSGEYRAFLEHLRASGDARLVAAIAPRRADGALLWRIDDDHVAMPQGWREEAPVRAIPWEGAAAYASWVAERTGQPWRLPNELEWEKAARGVDGRRYPWGDYLDPTWCCVADSHAGTPAPAIVGAWPRDTSPYGVRGLGGNVRDWVVAHDAPAGVPDAAVPAPARLVKGGWYGGIAQLARSALRHRLAWPVHPGVGFRLARSLRSAASPAAEERS